LKPDWMLQSAVSTTRRDGQKTQTGIETSRWGSSRSGVATVATDRKPRPGLKHDLEDVLEEEWPGRDGQKTQTGIETIRRRKSAPVKSLSGRDGQKTQTGIETALLHRHYPAARESRRTENPDRD